MGHAVDPPAVTHFGQDNVEASGPTIDLVAAEDLPSTEPLKNDDDWVYPYPTDFKIQEKPIDEVRQLKVCFTAHSSTEGPWLTIAGGSDRSWYRWYYCRRAAPKKGPWRPADYFRQEQRCCMYMVSFKRSNVF